VFTFGSKLSKNEVLFHHPKSGIRKQELYLVWIEDFVTTLQKVNFHKGTAAITSPYPKFPISRIQIFSTFGNFQDLTDTYRIDKKFGFSTYGCARCCYYDDQWIDDFNGPTGSSGNIPGWGYADCQSEYSFVDITSQITNWLSGNTGVATVSPGSTTGVGAGSTYSSGHVTLRHYQSYLQCPLVPVVPSGGLDFTPTVSISCDKTHLALGATAPTSTKQGACTATVNPTGGTFAWSVNSSSVTLTPNGASAIYTANAASTQQGDSTITLTYTISNAPSVSASSAAITVHKPTSLSIITDATDPSGMTCSVPCSSGTCSYASYKRTRVYDTLDQFGQSFSALGLSSIDAQESYGAVTSSCGSFSVQTGSAPITPFQDQWFMCNSACLSGGTGCTASSNQTITVNGYVVRTPAVTWTCTNCTVVP